jgi:dihydrofolate synthase/folylpolyglutamate synthase
MTPKTLSDWLTWQETLNPKEIDLGLERVSKVADRLELKPPAGRVFLVAGTNGKGSCTSVLEALLRHTGLSTGLYTSPHLLLYNERIRINNVPVADADLVSAFERIEQERGDTPLTFFEYGTLAALLLFNDRACDAWVLEVGLGGRLDATNIIDADASIITTVALDHQDWLGDTVELIAAEKAGIMGSGKPAFYGDECVPESIRQQAKGLNAPLGCLGETYRVTQHSTGWDWEGASVVLRNLPWPPARSAAQIRNQAVALAALESCEPAALAEPAAVRSTLAACTLPGRFQEYMDEHHWVLDVAHNVQAAGALNAQLSQLDAQPTVFVTGMLADKQAEQFAQELADMGNYWIACPTGSSRGSSADELACRLRNVLAVPVSTGVSVAAALELARQTLPDGGRIVVCGSFLVVGPALEWLGLY